MTRWNADENEAAFQAFVSNAKAKQPSIDAYQTKGALLEDYEAYCSLLGVLPHPKLAYEVKRDPATADPDATVDTPEAVVEIRDYRVDTGTIKALALALGRSRLLTRVSFLRCELSPRAARELFDSLPGIVPICDLMLDWSLGVGDALSKTPSSAVASAFARVSVLSLRATGLGDKEAGIIAEVLAKNDSINTLYLSDNHITDAGAVLISEALRTNKALSALSLSRNRLTNAAAEHLAASVGRYSLTPAQVAERKKHLQLVQRRKESVKPTTAPAAKGGPAKAASQKSQSTSGAAAIKPAASSGALALKVPTAPTSGGQTSPGRPGSAVQSPYATLPPDADIDAIIDSLQFEEREDGGGWARGNVALAYLNLSFNPITAGPLQPLFDAAVQHRQRELKVRLAEGPPLPTSTEAD